MNLTDRTLTTRLSLGLFELTTQDALSTICSTSRSYQGTVTIHNQLQWRCHHGQCKLASSKNDWLFEIHNTSGLQPACLMQPILLRYQIQKG